MTRLLHWELPQGVEELGPAESLALESLRRHLIDHHRSWGYQLVMPPMLEFADALPSVLSRDLDLLTFKLVDQHSGRMMALRSDMTPSAARICAQRFADDAPVRLCYAGTVLHARSEGAAGRAPLQFGAELFGEVGATGDAEIILLMAETLRALLGDDFVIDLGNTALYLRLCQTLSLQAQEDAALFAILQRKARPELEQWLAQRAEAAPAVAADLLSLIDLSGGVDVLARARAELRTTSLHVELDYLEQVVALVAERAPWLRLHIDLAELRGYRYHQSVVFAAYRRADATEVARGGRYSGLVGHYGQDRPATGYSLDLRRLLDGPVQTQATETAVFVPAEDVSAAWQAINTLREQGHTVVLGHAGVTRPAHCCYQLVQNGSNWIIRESHG